MPTIQAQISARYDDAEERASGEMYRTSTDLELSTDGTIVQTVGLRFLNINIPAGATITSAYIQFQTDEVSTGAFSLVIRGEDIGDAAEFTTTAFNLSSRPTTDASVGWTPENRTSVFITSRSITRAPSSSRISQSAELHTLPLKCALRSWSNVSVVRDPRRSRFSRSSRPRATACASRA